MKGRHHKRIENYIRLLLTKKSSDPHESFRLNCLYCLYCFVTGESSLSRGVATPKQTKLLLGMVAIKLLSQN